MRKAGDGGPAMGSVLSVRTPQSLDILFPRRGTPILPSWRHVLNREI